MELRWIVLSNAGAQLALVLWVSWNPQKFEKREMEPMDFEGKRGLDFVKYFFMKQRDKEN